jgi:iron complex outermembrane receptor protein
MPLTLGGNLNWTDRFVVQQTAAQAYRQGVKRVADVYALWRFSADLQVRLSASNLLAANYETGSQEVFGTTDQRAETANRTYRSYAARFEIRF